MRTALKVATVFNQPPSYSRRVMNIYGSSVFQYLPMTETSGTTIYDVSGNVRNGTAANITLASTEGPSGKKVPLWSGTAGGIDLYSAAYAAAFPYTEFTVSAWIKAANSGIWTDSTNRQVVYLRVDANNYIALQKTSTDNTLRVAYNAGATFDAVALIAYPTAWVHIAITVSKANDRLKFYYNGAQTGSTQTGIGVFAGTLSSTYSRIGTLDNSQQFWSGWISDVMVVSRESTDLEIRKVAESAPGAKLYSIGVLGDSIASAAGSWAYLLQRDYQSGAVGLHNHAVSGATIITDVDADADMDAQTVLAAADNADIIIVNLGTNDSETGAALTTEYAENLVELKANNPNARMFGMGILPRTDMTGVVEKNVRIAAACAAANVTYWDTTGWIDPATDTSDGIHPTAGGYAKIETQVLALL